MQWLVFRDRRAPQSLVLAGALLLASCTQQNSPIAAERLFDATRRDLGGIRAESDYSATYRLTNSTPRPLRVTAIKTSCGCVAAEFDRSEIRPGEHRDIVLNLSTRGQTVFGPLVKHASVEFDSGEKAYLTLAANLDSDFEVEPHRLEFTADERTHTLSLIRHQLDASSFSSLVLVAPPERYDVIEASSTPDRREFQITLKEESAGSSLPEIYFAEALGARPLRFSTVTCARTGPTLRPSTYVVVIADAASTPSAQQFQLIDFESQPVKLTDVKAHDELSRRYLTVEFDPAHDSKSFSVGLAETPSSSITSLFVSVTFEAIDGGVSGRLLLPCHIVTTGRGSIAHD